MKRSKFSIVLAALLLLALLLPAIASAATVDMAVSGGSLYLRKGPGRDYSSNGTVHDGDTITVVSYGDTWSKVRTEGGRTGYIKNLYINNGDSLYASGTEYVDRYNAYTTAKVNMRSGASTETVVMAKLNKGTKVKVLGKNDNFYLIQTENGSQGFVHRNYISRNKPSSSSSKPASTWTKTTTASYVNMREDGGMSADVIRVLPRGTKVEVIRVGNYWTKVSYKGTVGWIKNTYLK